MCSFILSLHRSCQWTAVIATIALLCLALMIGLILGLVAFTDEVEHSATGHYARAAVASDSVCSKIGRFVDGSRPNVRNQIVTSLNMLRLC